MRRPAVTRARGPALALLVALLSAGPGLNIAGAYPAADVRKVPAPTAIDAQERARKLIEKPGARSGPLEIGCQVLLEEPDGGSFPVPFQITLTLHPEHPPVGPFQVTFVAATLEGDMASAQSTVEPGDLSETETWVFRDVLELPDELYTAAAVVEDLGAHPERR